MGLSDKSILNVELLQIILVERIFFSPRHSANLGRIDSRILIKR